jgi:hypothetical protein
MRHAHAGTVAFAFVVRQELAIGLLMIAIGFGADLGPAERRRDSRGRTFKSGKLFYGGFAQSVADCLIIEMSDSGARVETGVMVHVPEIFMLHVNGADRRVRRMWAVGNQIGVEFLAEPVT